MKKTLPCLLFCSFLIFHQLAFAGGWLDAPRNITFIKNARQSLSYARQAQLRQGVSWQTFSKAHAGWHVLFDEQSGMPHRAYGKGIFLPSTGNAKDDALGFITREMASFGVAPDQLVLRNAHASGKYHYVDFYQTYQGLEVLGSRVMVRTTLDHRVVLFGADAYHDIQLSTTPQIAAAAISSYAVNGISYQITGITTDPSLKILPVPMADRYEYHLVYLVTVNARDDDGYPARYYTLVDANNGDVLYRHDQIDHLNDLLTAQSMVSDPNPWEPTVLKQLPYLRVHIGNTDYYTDAIGNLSLAGITLPATATVYLQGTWSKVVTGNNGSTAPSYTQQLVNGTNIADFTSHSTVQQVSAYYHVNVIHDYIKSWLPNYDEMDVSLLTDVDRTDGTCNAYYDGVSINFYAQGAGCFDLATAGDVVYHEYSHGTDGRWYSLYSNGLDNGALNEGYSDVWAIAKTENPVLGIGFSDTDPNAYVRRYDINKKVYPEDIQGESHADGEIICGCWYDTWLNLGNVDSMMALFTEALNGCADGFDGTEGVVYRDVLLDALAADDDDGDLNNGTPNDLAILSAFALHGISLMGEITLDHTEPLTEPALLPVSIQADITVDYPIYLGDAYVHYKKNTESNYDSIQMNLISGNTYAASLPEQPAGTILDYYFTVSDVYGINAAMRPSGVLDADANLPFKMLISFNNTLQEDFDTYEGPWLLYDVQDNATTGQWAVDSPTPSYLTPGNPASIVQTNQDHTPNNNTNICVVTGQAGINDAAGTNDCDNGRNTLYSPKYDLTGYTNPAISYYRWYSNDQGANPGNDPWRVYITNGDGSWLPIEYTYTADHSWRCMAFRVKDYVTLSEQIQLKFIASDSTMNNVDNNGQSLVEAAVDDLFLWAEADNVGISAVHPATSLFISPNPASTHLDLTLSSAPGENAVVRLLDVFGKNVFSFTLSPSQTHFNLPVSGLENGIYTLQLDAKDITIAKKIVVQH